MNKNIVKLIAILAMCFMLCSLLVACKGDKGDQGEQGLQGETGAQGPQGEKGEQGLQGETGPQGPVGETGAQGEKGDKGDKGDQGEKGETGAQGPAGENGQDGHTPYIGENGNWWINGEDTGVVADAQEFVCDEHTWDSYTLRGHSPAEDGVDLYICEVCGWAEFRYVGHDFGLDANFEIITAPTETETGVVRIDCASDNCDCTYDAPIPALNSGVYMLELGNCVTPDKYHLSVFLPGVELSNGDVVDIDTIITVEVLSTDMSHHSFTTFDAEGIENGSWKLVIDEVSKCPCEADKIYYPVCQNGCGVDFNAPEFDDVHQVIAAPGHVFDLENGWHEAEKKPGESPCHQAEVWVNECLVCYKNNDLVHMDCVLTETREEAPGHTWGPWSVIVEPTATTVGEAIRICTVCEQADYGELKVPDTIELPALNDTDYAYAVTVPATCVNSGEATYTYTHTDGTTIVITVTLAPNGHAYSADSKYTVDASTNVPVLSLECDDCDHVEVINLPELYIDVDGDGVAETLNRGYLVQYGHCLQKDDLYTFALALDEETTIVVEFAVNGGYEHDEAPTKDGEVDLDKCVLVEGTEKNYYVYKCDKCGQWIVAYVKNK